VATVVSGAWAEPGTVSSISFSRPANTTIAGRALYVFWHAEDTAVTNNSRPTGFARVDAGTITDPIAIDATGAGMRLFAYRCDGPSVPAGTLAFGMSASAYSSYGWILTDADGGVLSVDAKSESISGGNGRVGAVTLAANQLAIAFGGGYASGSAEACTNWLEPTGSTRGNFYRTTTTATEEALTTGGGFDSTRWVSVTLTIADTGGVAATSRPWRRRPSGLIYR
jgi:hypothetical protein